MFFLCLGQIQIRSPKINTTITVSLLCVFFCTQQVYYKDDLNWMKGIGCFVWDTPEILRAKKSYELQSDVTKSN